MKTHPRLRPGRMQAEALDRMVEHVDKHGVPMTGADLARLMGVTKQYTSQLLIKLAATGYMEQRGGTSLFWPVIDSDGKEYKGKR